MKKNKDLASFYRFNLWTILLLFIPLSYIAATVAPHFSSSEIVWKNHSYSIIQNNRKQGITTLVAYDAEWTAQSNIVERIERPKVARMLNWHGVDCLILEVTDLFKVPDYYERRTPFVLIYPGEGSREIFIPQHVDFDDELLQVLNRLGKK